MDRSRPRFRHRSPDADNRNPAVITNRLLAALVLLGMTVTPAAHAQGDGTTIYKYIDSDGNIVFTDHPTKGAQKIHVNPPPPIPLTPVHIDNDNGKKGEQPSAPPKDQSQEHKSSPPLPQMRMKPPAGQTPPPAHQANDGGQTASQSSVTPATPSPSAEPQPQSKEQPVGHQGNATTYRSLKVVSPRPGLQIAKPGGTIIVQLKPDPALDTAAGDRFRITIDGNTVVDDSTSTRHMINGLKPGPHALVAMVIRQVSNQARNLIESKPLQFELAKAPKKGGTTPSDAQ